MRPEPCPPRGNNLLKRALGHRAANLINLLADDPQHDARRSRIGVKVKRSRRAIRHRPFPMLVRPGGEAMHGFRGLHQAELGDAVTAPVVLDERRDGHMDRQEPLRLMPASLSLAKATRALNAGERRLMSCAGSARPAPSRSPLRPLSV